MRVKAIVAQLLILSLFITSCSSFQNSSFNLFGFRTIAGIEDDLQYYLGVDRFHYYITEYSHNMEGKIPEDAMAAIKKISAKQLFAEGYTVDQLKNAHNYDKMITDWLKKYHPEISFNQTDMQWGYNFLKNKLNEAFAVKETKLKGDLVNPDFAPTPARPQVLTIANINPEELTLDSGHYISNRTTRAMFWEAAETGKTVEFHLGDSREFMKHIQQSGAEVIAEINPMAANYNKQFVVKYPGENTYRYAVTNIGGADRLEHMIHSLALSNLAGGNLQNKVVVHGDLQEFHKRMTAKLTEQMEHLPNADRVIIGQRGAIDGQFNLFWKLQGLQNMYEQDPTKLKLRVGADQFEQIEDMFEKTSSPKFSVHDHKKVIEKNYEKVKGLVEADPNMMPAIYKQFDYDTTQVQMTDFVFKNSQGKSVRWRVLGNVWGDEVVPLAQALKNTGHKEITYIGTAGAVPGKGYKVGDLVVPAYVQDGTSKLRVHGDVMDIDLAKVGGAVEHVGSPFEETFDWLDLVKQRSDFVEIESSYLRRIFNGTDDNLRFYLLISDILGSEGETLASASSSKRRKALNAILDTMFARDKAKIPKPVDVPLNSAHMKLRSLIDKLYNKKGKVFQHYVQSHFKGKPVPSEEALKSFVDSVDNFSDDFFSKRVVSTSEVLSYIVRDISENLPVPTLGVSQEFLDGAWHPKTDKLKVQIYSSNTEILEQYRQIVEKYEDAIGDISKWAEIEVVRGPPPEGMVALKATNNIEPDYLVKAFTRASFMQGGLDYDVTYNGALKYHILPTNKSTNVCEVGNKFCSLAYYAPDPRTKDLLGEITEVEGFNPEQRLKDAIADLSDELKYKGNDEEWKAVAKLKKVNSLPDGKMAEIVPVFSNTEGLVIEVRITPQGLKNPMVVAEEMAHLKQIVDEPFMHPIHWAEITLNAQYGSKRSAMLLAEAEVDAMEKVRYDILDVEEGSQVDEYIKARKAQGEKLVKSVKKEVTAENKMRKTITNRYKALLKQLEDSPKKLDDYIAAGDRVNARKLIDSFMPWEEMEPTEVALWTRWLDAMEHPATQSSKKTLVFRGLADDLVRESNDGGHFLMSKLLTKNQGNYTRRLRSLKTYHGKLGKMARGEVPLKVDSYTAMMKGHSHDPVASPFLSTSVADVADNFADEWSGSGDNIKKIAAIHIDKRRIMTNLVSDYREAERLIPLIVFPDEIVHIEQATESYDSNFMNKLYGNVKQKIGREVKSEEKVQSNNAIDRLKNTKAWWESVNPAGLTPNNVGTTCRDMVESIMGL
ncbi:MAG: hypothetical protein EP326_08730 [Deltaproteobacteria bacterium]|nr:MAG: hypothetical protein EP326_08730 [Deltaproteobacteria bacterium]